jgi:hypothetical protein
LCGIRSGGTSVLTRAGRPGDGAAKAVSPRWRWDAHAATAMEWRRASIAATGGKESDGMGLLDLLPVGLGGFVLLGALWDFWRGDGARE